MKAVIIGATAGVGRALATQLASQRAELVLIARDARDLDAMAADFGLRFEATIHVLAADVANPDAEKLQRFVRESLNKIDALFVIAGMTDPADRGTLPDQAMKLVASANFIGPARAVNALLPLCGPRSHIVLAGSVASIRPRGGNTVYGAAKTALEHYGMAIRHAFTDGLGSVCCYRFGYIRTAMTFGQKLPLPAATPEQVADVIIRRLGQSGVVYYPAWWRLVAICLRCVPWFVFKRLRF